jgi:TatD DNase family protein
VLIDTHCHLDFNAFDQDRNEVLSRARQSGVEALINPGVDIESSRAAIRNAEVYAGVFAAVGIHPTECAAWDDNAWDQLVDLAGKSNVVAIGEIGLDYHHQQVGPETQKMVLLRQLDLAANLSLPVIIHNRKSSDDLYVILSNWCSDLIRTHSPLAKRPGVLHSFEGDFATAEEFIKLNFLIGIGGPVTFKNARARQDLAAGLPLDRILLETDAPFLAPMPFRGRRNEPANIRLIAEHIADLKAVPFEDLAVTTTQNAAYLFSREF